MPEPTPQPEPRALAPRKRVVARDVTAEVEAAAHDGAELVPAVILPSHEGGTASIPADPDPVPVVDPTLLGPRHRRTSHLRIYRWTQACTLLSGLAGVVGLVCALAEDVHIARWVAGPGVVVGALAAFLAGRTSLSERWRGWAIAAAVFAAATFGFTWVVPALTGEEHVDPRTKSPAKALSSPPDAR